MGVMVRKRLKPEYLLDLGAKMNIDTQIITALKKLLESVPNRNVGICNNLPLLLPDVRVKTACRGRLKELFSSLGLDKDYPVEMQTIKDKEKAKETFYSDTNKWGNKSQFGKTRQQLVKDLITQLEK